MVIQDILSSIKKFYNPKSEAIRRKRTLTLACIYVMTGILAVEVLYVVKGIAQAKKKSLSEPVNQTSSTGK